MARRLPRTARAAINRLGYAARRARSASVVDVAIIATFLPGHARCGPDAREDLKTDLDYKADHQYAKRRDSSTQVMACDDHSHSENTPAVDDYAAHHHPETRTDNSAAHHHCDNSLLSAECLTPAVDTSQWNVNATIFTPALLQTELLLQALGQEQTIDDHSNSVNIPDADHADFMQHTFETSADRLTLSLDACVAYVHGDRKANARNEDGSEDIADGHKHGDLEAYVTHHVHAAGHIKVSQDLDIDDHINSLDTTAADDKDFYRPKPMKSANRLTPTEDCDGDHEYGDRKTNVDFIQHMSERSADSLTSPVDAHDVYEHGYRKANMRSANTSAADRADSIQHKPKARANRLTPTVEADAAYEYGDRKANTRTENSSEDAAEGYEHSENTPGANDQGSIQLTSQTHSESPIPTVNGTDGHEYGDREAHARNEDSSDSPEPQPLAVDDTHPTQLESKTHSVRPISTVYSPVGHEYGDRMANTRTEYSSADAADGYEHSENIPGAIDKGSIQSTFQTHSESPIPTVNGTDGHEYGDREAHARKEDSSDSSVPQPLAVDDTHTPPS